MITHFAPARFAAAVLAGAFSLAVTVPPAEARGSKRDEHQQSRPGGAPVMAVVSLARQRVTAYDADGWIMKSPVSSGKSGYETPAGIYSILQRKVEHYSNLYDDAAMPFMQRLTWSGIALHAGALPGYPASAGCVRMPISFAERLFDASRMGMRVIVMRDDIAPVPFAHPRLFKPWSDEQLSRVAMAPRLVAIDAEPPAIAPLQDLRRTAAEKTAAAEEATAMLDQARRAVGAKRREAAMANRKLRVAHSTKFRAERHLKRVERLPAADDPEAVATAEEVKAKAAATLAQAEAALTALRAQVDPLLDEMKQLREAAIEAQKAKTTADEEARDARRKIAPIAVFVSRATKRLYVRQGFQPLFETEVAIADEERPTGTYIFTALAYQNGETDMRWNAISMYGRAQGAERHRGRSRGVSDPLTTDVAGAGAALDRVIIPDEALARISAVISPGSSLIVSDEPPSRETGPATEFVVVMSGEPQGGIKLRKPQAERRQRYERLIRRSPYSGGGSSWFW